MYWTMLVGVVEPAHLTVASYLQIGIGYNYFCEEPLSGQPGHRPQHYIVCNTAKQYQGQCTNVCAEPATLLQKLLQFDTCRDRIIVRQMIQGCMFDSKKSYYITIFSTQDAVSLLIKK